MNAIGSPFFACGSMHMSGKLELFLTLLIVAWVAFIPLSIANFCFLSSRRIPIPLRNFHFVCLFVTAIAAASLVTGHARDDLIVPIIFGAPCIATAQFFFLVLERRGFKQRL